MAKIKLVSIAATLKCTQVSGTTTFIKKDNTAKIGDIELATEDNTEIVPFTEDCEKGGCLGFGGKPCIPKLKKWKKNTILNKKVNGGQLLIETSITECETIAGAEITIDDPKQDTIFYDSNTLMIEEALEKLNEMLAFRLDQYENDLDKFNACFDKYFGEGHSPENKERITNRMRAAKNLLPKYTNADGTLNEDRFIYDEERFFSHGGKTNTLAYVYNINIIEGQTINGNVYTTDHVIHINPLAFDNGSINTSGFETLPGFLAHEISHFDDIGNATMENGNGTIGGTLDLGYRGEAMDLVVGTNIMEALNNADNFRLFLESGEDCVNFSSS